MDYKPNARIQELETQCHSLFGVSVLRVAEIADKYGLSVTFVAKFIATAPNTLRKHLAGLGKADLLPARYGRPYCDPTRIAQYDDQVAQFREEMRALYSARKNAAAASIAGA